MQRRFKPRKRICSFCADKSAHIDYKDINKLKKYITERISNNYVMYSGWFKDEE